MKLEEVQVNPSYVVEEGGYNPETSKRGRPRKQHVYEEEYLTNDLDVQVETKEEEEEEEEAEFECDEASVDDDSDVPLCETIKKSSRAPERNKKRLKRSPKKGDTNILSCCCLCQVEVKDEDELRTHIDSFHQSHIETFLRTQYNKYTLRHKYECKFCRRKYMRKGSLDKHFEIPSYDEPPRKRYGGPKKKEKTGDNGAVCTVCGKMYYDKYDLELHELRIHATEKPIVCPHPGCDKRFAAEKLMKKHFRFHGERKHICEVKTNLMVTLTFDN